MHWEGVSHQSTVHWTGQHLSKMHSTNKILWRRGPAQSHLELVFQESGKNVVADPGGAEGVQVDPFLGQPVSELQVQDADVGHGSSHGVADDVKVRVWVLLQQLPHRFRHVRLQRAAVVGDEEACGHSRGQLWAIFALHLQILKSFLTFIAQPCCFCKCCYYSL